MHDVPSAARHTFFLWVGVTMRAYIPKTEAFSVPRSCKAVCTAGKQKPITFAVCVFLLSRVNM